MSWKYHRDNRGTTRRESLVFSGTQAEGSQMMSPMAIGVNGDLIVSALLTRIIVLIVYSIFDDLAHRI